MNKKYEYILLDWDGNLAKTLDIWLDAFRRPLLSRGIEVTDEQIAMSFGQFKEYLVLWGAKDIEAIEDEAVEIAKKLLPEVELYPDALEVLNALKQKGKKMALITTSTRENVLHLLIKHDLEHFFDAIVAGDDVKQHKPHPESLEKALLELGGTTQEAIMIGDTDKDIGAANNLGIDSILFYPPEHKKFYDLDKFKSLNPTYVVSDFKEIISIV